MDSIGSKVSVKVIGANGQISLGKQYAGRQVLVEEQEPGVWLVRTASVVPDNERWLHEPQARGELARALQAAERTPPQRSDPESLGRLAHGARRKQGRAATPARRAPRARAVRPRRMGPPRAASSR